MGRGARCGTLSVGVQHDQDQWVRCDLSWLQSARRWAELAHQPWCPLRLRALPDLYRYDHTILNSDRDFVHQREWFIVEFKIMAVGIKEEIASPCRRLTQGQLQV